MSNKSELIEVRFGFDDGTEQSVEFYIPHGQDGKDGVDGKNLVGAIKNHSSNISQEYPATPNSSGQAAGLITMKSWMMQTRQRMTVAGIANVGGVAASMQTIPCDPSGNPSPYTITTELRERGGATDLITRVVIGPTMTGELTKHFMDMTVTPPLIKPMYSASETSGMFGVLPPPPEGEPTINTLFFNVRYVETA